MQLIWNESEGQGLTEPQPYIETAVRGRITILDIIHRPVFYLKHSVSETRFCLRLHVETI
jgi:hypothetical protein